MRRIFFKFSPEAEPTTSSNAEFAGFAAPFDTPTHFILSSRGDGAFVAQLSYALGSDEETVEERMYGGITMHVGRVSGRIMRLDIPSERYDALLAGVAEELKLRQHRIAEKAKQRAPLRVAAHYGLIGSQLLPAMSNVLSQQTL